MKIVMKKLIDDNLAILQNEKKMVSSQVKIFLHHFGKDKGYSECP